jgi:hypothetical protein
MLSVVSYRISGTSGLNSKDIFVSYDIKFSIRAVSELVMQLNRVIEDLDVFHFCTQASSA